MGPPSPPEPGRDEANRMPCDMVLGLYPTPSVVFPADLLGEMNVNPLYVFDNLFCSWIYMSQFGKSVMVRVARILGKDRRDAAVESIVIDTTLDALAVITSGRLTRSLCGLVVAIARFRSLDERRRQVRQPDALDSTIDVQAPLDSLCFAHSDLIDRAMAWLQKRYPDLCGVVNDHYWGGLSTPEIATLRNIPQATVRSRLHNGRGRIYEYLLDRAVREGLLPGYLVGEARAWLDLDPASRVAVEHDPQWENIRRWMYEWITRT